MSGAGYDDDDDDSGGLFLALVIAAGYFAFQLYRGRLAAAIGGGVFEAAPPANDLGEGILNILVPLRLSSTGAAFIKQQEGFRPNPYPDGKGHSSIGYGHQIQAGDAIVPPITQGEAESLFAGDIAAAEKAVSDALLVQVSQSQFDALVDFAFNEGAGAFRGSTLLQLLNGGDFAGAAGQFSRWVYSGGVVNPVLQARRAGDLNLFNFGG